MFVWLRISPARIKLTASNFARWFIGVQSRESPILGNFAPPETQNRTDGRAEACIADRRQSPQLTATRRACGHALGMCGYTAVHKDRRTCCIWSYQKTS